MNAHEELRQLIDDLPEDDCIRVLAQVRWLLAPRDPDVRGYAVESLAEAEFQDNRPAPGAPESEQDRWGLEDIRPIRSVDDALRNVPTGDVVALLLAGEPWLDRPTN